MLRPRTLVALAIAAIAIGIVGLLFVKVSLPDLVLERRLDELSRGAPSDRAMGSAAARRQRLGRRANELANALRQHAPNLIERRELSLMRLDSYLDGLEQHKAELELAAPALFEVESIIDAIHAAEGIEEAPRYPAYSGFHDLLLFGCASAVAFARDPARHADAAELLGKLPAFIRVTSDEAFAALLRPPFETWLTTVRYVSTKTDIDAVALRAAVDPHLAGTEDQETAGRMVQTEVRFMRSLFDVHERAPLSARLIDGGSSVNMLHERLDKLEEVRELALETCAGRAPGPVGKWPGHENQLAKLLTPRDIKLAFAMRASPLGWLARCHFARRVKAVARVALAAAAFEGKHGRWADDLRELDALFEGGVPPDACSGKPLVYVVDEISARVVSGSACAHASGLPMKAFDDWTWRRTEGR